MKKSVFEKKYHYRPCDRGCLDCGNSSSEPWEPYDRLHCSEMPVSNDVVDEDMVCDLGKDDTEK
jgi:hypothetical protein